MICPGPATPPVRPWARRRGWLFVRYDLPNRVLHAMGFERFPVTEDCERCGGSGWYGQSLGMYDRVCGDCIGGQQLARWTWRWTAWGMW